jgi:CheY-like chemotaxis protein
MKTASYKGAEPPAVRRVPVPGGRRGRALKRIAVPLADDHVALRKGLSGLLEAARLFEVVGQTGDGRKAVKLARTLRPDVIVMDFAMPVFNRLEATRQILLGNAAARVLIFQDTVTMSMSTTRWLPARQGFWRAGVCGNSDLGNQRGSQRQ